MPTLTILRGISGSGKSTWASQQSAVIVSRDALREVYFPNFTPEEYYSSDILGSMEKSITRVQDSTIKALLSAGRDVIVDNTNIEWKYVTALAEIGWAFGATVAVMTFEVPAITAIVRDFTRGQRGGRMVGEDIIRKQHARLEKTKHFTLPEGPN